MKALAGLFTPAILGAALFASFSAAADPAYDADSARALFREGRALAADGKYEAACPKFERSMKLDPGIGTKFNLADCYEHIDRTATARTLFLEVAALAREAGQGDREGVAEARARDLEPRIHRLTIDVKGKQSGLSVRRDGVEVLPSAWGQPEFVDPGAHALEVNAPGKKPFSTHVDVPRTGDATVEVPELDDVGEPKEAVAQETAAEPPKTEPAPPPAGDAEPAKSAPDLTIPLVVYGGVGASAVLAGTALILYKSANDKAEGICPSGVNCSHDEIQRHQGYVNDARDARTLAYVGLGVAGAALITGGALALFRSNHERNPAQARVGAAPLFGPGTFGAAVGGRF